MPVGKADERSEMSVAKVIQSLRPNTKKTRPCGGFLCLNRVADEEQREAGPTTSERQTLVYRSAKPMSAVK